MLPLALIFGALGAFAGSDMVSTKETGRKKNQLICIPKWLLTANSTFAGRNASGGSEKECQNIVHFMEA